MPHGNGKIWSEVDSNGKKIGISSDDVVAVIRERRHDWGTLCSSAKINKWAIFKPVPIDNPGQDLRETKSVVNPFTGTAMNVIAAIGTPGVKTVAIGSDQIPLYVFYGIGMPMFITGDNFTLRKKWVDLLASHPEINWPYYRINPLTEFSRITDFDGYDHFLNTPFQYWVSDCYTQHAGMVSASWFSDSSNDNVIDMMKLADFLNMDMTVKVDIVNKATGSLIETIVLGDLDQTTDTSAMYGPYNFSQDTQLHAYFYAMGQQGNNVWCILFPSLPEYPNPMEMTAHKATGDPQEIILANIDILSSGTGFAFLHSSSFFESFSNVGENLYSRLLTNGTYCIRAKLINPSNSGVTINKTDLGLYWEESGQPLSFRLYDNNSEVSSVTIPANEKVMIDLEIIDIFTGMTAVDGTDYGDIEYMKILYKGQEAAVLNTTVTKVPETDIHLGWFYSGYVGYYTTNQT